MENTNCVENETKLLSCESDNVTKCDKKTTQYNKMNYEFHREASYSSCSIVKTCLRYVCCGLVVSVFLFLLHKNNELESRIAVEQQEQHKSSSDVFTFDAVNSPHNDMMIGDNFLKQLENYTPRPPTSMNDKTDNVRSTSNLDVNKSKEISEGNHILEKGRHYFDIRITDETMMQDCFHSHMKHSFPDIDYAFLGYDAPRGYPLAHGHDPGFTFPIFHADYTNGKQTADCRYRVPKGLVVVPDVSCDTSFTSDIIRTSEQLKRELFIIANVDGSGSRLAFSTSVYFKQASSDLSANELVYIISSASCNYYFSKFQKEDPPPFTDVFVDWLTKLNTSASDSTYLQFLQTFGTHFPTEIMFGARYIYEHKMKSSIYEKKQDENVTITSQASTSCLIDVGKGLHLSEQEKEAASSFSKSVETKTITVGPSPPRNRDATTWAASVQKNPVPAKYTMETIENLFQEEFMGELNVNYKAILIKLKLVKELYYHYKIDKLSNERFTKLLTVENGGQYGHWFTPQFCPAKTFAVGFNLKYEEDKANAGDKTGLNGITILCANRQGKRLKIKNSVRSVSGHKGSWTGDAYCPQGNGVPQFLQSFALMVQEPVTDDETAANEVRFTCRDLQKIQNSKIIEKHVTGMKGQLGKWSEVCPLGSAICGLQTRVQPHTPQEDNTALNDVRFFCCTLE